MEVQSYKWSWDLIEGSVIGSTHIRNNVPNQDAIASFSPEDNGESFIVALSDGHGGRRHFRSKVGADLAVKVAQEVMQEFLQNSLPTFSNNLSTIKNEAEERIPHSIVNEWKAQVKDHWEQNQFAAAELEDLVEEENQFITNDPFIAYGATLLVVLVTETCIIHFQLGDGEIFTVLRNSEVAGPFPENTQLIITRPASLCLKNAWDYFKVSFQHLPDKKQWPVLIFLCTDGYANSFKSTERLHRVGPEILGMIHTYGLKNVKEHLQVWLKGAIKFTGDDATLAILCRTDILDEVPSSNDNEESKESKNSDLNDSETLNTSQLQENEVSPTESENVITEEKPLDSTDNTTPSQLAANDNEESEESKKTSPNSSEISNVSSSQENEVSPTESENVITEKKLLDSTDNTTSPDLLPGISKQPTYQPVQSLKPGTRILSKIRSGLWKKIFGGTDKS